MRENCKSRIINLFQSIKNLEPNQKQAQAMLILDDVTTSLLSAVIQDFFCLGMKNVTKASLNKKPEMTYSGIYFISAESLPCVVKDFHKAPIYQSINILLPQQITAQIMKKVSSEKKIVQRLAYFGQLRLGTKYLYNSCGLLINQQKLFASIVRGEPSNASQLAKKLFQSIVSGFSDSLCLKIHFKNSPFINSLVSSIAEYQKSHRAQLLENQAVQNEAKVLTVILVDRKIDMISPLVQNFTYFSMICDLFKIDCDNRQLKLRDGKSVKIDLQDQIFSQYKTMLISKAQNTIEPNFSAFKAESVAKKAKLEQKASNTQIKQIIRDIPKFNRMVVSYQQQISIMHDITSMAKEINLPAIGQLEQMIVTGTSGISQEVKDKKIVHKVLEYCTKFTQPDYAVKMLVLLLLCVEVGQTDKTNIIGKIRENQRYQKLANFLQSNLKQIVNQPGKLKPMFKKQKIYLDLHQAMITNLCCQLIEKGKTKSLSYVQLRAEPKKSPSKFANVQKKTQNEIVVCMLGGIGANQMCQLQQLEQKYPNVRMNILSTDLFNSWSYLRKLQSIFTTNE